MNFIRIAMTMTMQEASIRYHRREQGMAVLVQVLALELAMLEQGMAVCTQYLPKTSYAYLTPQLTVPDPFNLTFAYMQMLKLLLRVKFLARRSRNEMLLHRRKLRLRTGNLCI